MPTQIATDPGLLDRLRASSAKPMTREQRRRQRISFIVGGLPEGSTITRSQIEAVLAEDDKA